MPSKEQRHFFERFLAFNKKNTQVAILIAYKLTEYANAARGTPSVCQLKERRAEGFRTVGIFQAMRLRKKGGREEKNHYT